MFDNIENFIKFIEENNLDYEIQYQEDEYGHWCEDSWTSLEDAWGSSQSKIIIVVKEGY